MSKLDYACEVLGRAFAHPPNCTGPTLREAHSAIQSSQEGFASFMAAQVVADLKNTLGHPLQDASDWHSFSAYGPGSLRGLSWYFDKPIRPNTYEAAIE